jgi:catechol 2,3-dioxygenase-like lactoylglutathione lyase family enzyme
VEIWYTVRNLEAARSFYVDTLGFEEVYRDEADRWLRVARESAGLVLAESEEPASAEQPVFTVDVKDVKREASRLRAAGANVGVVVEIPGTIRLLDVFDPDGNRLQLSEEL